MTNFIVFCIFAFLCIASSVMCIEIVQTLLSGSAQDRGLGYLIAVLCAASATLSGIIAGYTVLHGIPS